MAAKPREIGSGKGRKQDRPEGRVFRTGMAGAHLQEAWALVISIPVSRGSTFNIPGERITSQVHPSSREALCIMIARHTKKVDNAAEKVPQDEA